MSIRGGAEKDAPVEDLQTLEAYVKDFGVYILRNDSHELEWLGRKRDSSAEGYINESELDYYEVSIDNCKEETSEEEQEEEEEDETPRRRLLLKQNLDLKYRSEDIMEHRDLPTPTTPPLLDDEDYVSGYSKMEELMPACTEKERSPDIIPRICNIDYERMFGDISCHDEDVDDDSREEKSDDDGFWVGKERKSASSLEVSTFIREQVMKYQ
tara:strand:- start:4325 stop:4960 length:636 start_codon:yes stop_codon:yes gene_type:complete